MIIQSLHSYVLIVPFVYMQNMEVITVCESQGLYSELYLYLYSCMKITFVYPWVLIIDSWIQAIYWL